LKAVIRNILDLDAAALQPKAITRYIAVLHVTESIFVKAVKRV
jgi:hypothetical protein